MKIRLFFGIAAAVFSCILLGCKTATVPVAYTVPARLDLSGIKRIGIESNNPQVESIISQRLTEAGKTIASDQELQEWKQWKAERGTMEQLANYQARAIEVSAADLAEAYTANAVRADSSYQRKTLRITAVVKEIGKSSKGSYFVRFAGAGNDSVDVYFLSSEINRVANVDKGQTITIIGECLGFNPPDMEDTAEILRILGGGRAINISNATFPADELKDYPGAVDAVISMEQNLSVQDDSSIQKEIAKDENGKDLKDAEGKYVYRDVTVYTRNVTVDITYQIVRTRDSSNIGNGVKSARTKSPSSYDQSKLPAPADLAAKISNKPLSEFISEIVPTQRSISVTLAKEKDNKDAKKAMSAAQKLVKEKKYADAASAYGKIYAEYKNFAAGYNHALLTEAAMDIESAITLMEALFKETGNRDAQSALTGMQSRNASNQNSAEQLSE